MLNLKYFTKYNTLQSRIPVNTPDCYLHAANLGFMILFSFATSFTSPSKHTDFTNFFSFPTSFTLPSKRKVQGTSSPPCGKLAEYLLCPAT